MFDRIAIGRRIVEARKRLGLNSPKALAKAMQEKLDARAEKDADAAEQVKKKAKLAGQTVDNWERGKYVPPADKVELMAQVFGPEHDEEWIMFGPRRARQLAQDRSVIARVNEEEESLLQTYRAANEQGRRSILAISKTLASDNPAAGADIHRLRRTSDMV